MPMHLLETKGQDYVQGFCIIKSLNVRTSANGSTYLDMVVGDAGGEVAAKLWSYDKTAHGEYQPGQIIKVRGTVSEWQGRDQLKITMIRLAAPGDDYDLMALVPCAPIDVEQTYADMHALVEKFENQDLKKLTLYFLDQNRAALLVHPGAFKLHHAMRGGLLYHTYTILRMAQAACRVYPQLNPELLYCGVILHDMAKLHELEADELGLCRGYTVAGNLLGHIAMGVAHIETAARELAIDPYIALMVEHMVLSHHGEPDTGSPVRPMFPEADALSELDMLDARMFIFSDHLRDISSGAFTDRIWALDNRKIFNHGLAPQGE